MRGWGTMTVWPWSSRYLAWLPRLEMKSKPSEARMLMKAEEERRLGIGRAGDGEFPDGDFSDAGGGLVGVFEVEFDGFLEVG